MRHVIPLAVAAGLVCLAPSAQRAVADAVEANAIMRTDETLTRALEKQDLTAAERLLDGDFSWIDSQGILRFREDALRARLKPLVGTGANIKTLEHEYNKVVLIQRSNGSDNYSAHFWVQRPSGWRLLQLSEIVVRQRDFKPARPNFEVPCINPCTVIPYIPVSLAEKEFLAAYQEQETGPDQSGWIRREADNYDQRLVATFGGVSDNKADRTAVRLRNEAALPGGAPYVAVAPVLWGRSWDFDDAVVSIMLHPTYGDKAYWSTVVYAKIGGIWQMAESYHNYIMASPIMTAVPTSESSDPRANAARRIPPHTN
jgi:hypothetical protein